MGCDLETIKDELVRWAGGMLTLRRRHWPATTIGALLILLVLVVSVPVFPNAVAAQDTVRVEAGDVGRWGGTLEAVEELRIGALTGKKHETFGLITDLGVADDGAMWIVDSQVPVIYRYDSRGRYLKSVGREGGGPGEYRRPMGVETLPDGRVALWDDGNSRINVYDSAGTVQRSHRVRADAPSHGEVLHVDTAGHFYVRTHLQSAGGPSGQGLLKIGPTGSVADTIRLPDRETSSVMGFRRETLFAWSPRRVLVVGHNDGYSFTIRQADGASVTVIRETDPVPLKPGEYEWWEARAEQRERQVEAHGGEAEVPPIPETKPAFENLRADADGRVWVQRHVAAKSFEGTTDGEERTVWWERPTFDIYAPDATFLGTVRLPYRTQWLASRGRTVWGLHFGEYNEIYVVRYGLVGGQ